MTHEELRELLPLAALGTVEEAERRELEAHLATCPTCPGDLAALREAVGWMGAAVAPVEPSRALDARIASIASRPPKTATAPAAGFRRTVTGMVGFAAAAVVAAVVMYAWGLATRVQSVETELASERELSRFLASADTATIVLAGTEQAPKSRLKLAYDRHTGKAVLFAYELPSPPEGQAYQVWFIAGGKPVPGRVFSPDSTGRGVWQDEVPPEGREASVFAVTLEPAGGVSAPTGPMVMKSVSVS